MRRQITRHPVQKYSHEFPVHEIAIDPRSGVRPSARTTGCKQRCMRDSWSNSAEHRGIIGQVRPAPQRPMRMRIYHKRRRVAVDLGHRAARAEHHPARGALLPGHRARAPVLEHRTTSPSCMQLHHRTWPPSSRSTTRSRTPWRRWRPPATASSCPPSSELTLEEPEIVKQGGRYGVRLKAVGPLHPHDEGQHQHRGLAHRGQREAVGGAGDVPARASLRRAPAKSGSPTSSASPCTSWSTRGCTTS